eukprot:scaffold1448_cov387-Prasinococcus_capsulatus_cf.AAC.8
MAVGQAAPSIAAIATGKAAGKRVVDMIERVSKIDSTSTEGLKPATCQGNISFESVFFAYPTRPDVMILSGFTATIAAGSSFAIVGASGSGKSTATALLQRFYDPLSGLIAVDGNDIKALNIRWLRHQLGLVSQEPVLFAASIYENLLYGNQKATAEQVEAACRVANIQDFINSLPDKYDTYVGKRSAVLVPAPILELCCRTLCNNCTLRSTGEQGVQLSGGQKQRIAIARAVLKDPRILLLDEATSALDAESEEIVSAALHKLMVNRTSIIVAHRLSTIRSADQIAVLQQGVLVEQGSHDELIAKNGAYKSLVRLQLGQEIGEDAASDTSAHNPADTLPARDDTPENQQEAQTESHSKNGPLATGDTKPSHPNEGNRRPVPLSRLLVFLTPSDWIAISLGLVGAAGMGAATPLNGYLLGQCINIFFYTDAESIKRGTDEYGLYFVALAGAAFLAALMAEGSLGRVGTSLSSLRTSWTVVHGSDPYPAPTYAGGAGTRMTMRLRTTCFKTFLRQDIEYYDTPGVSSGVLTARLGKDGAAGVPLVDLDPSSLNTHATTGGRSTKSGAAADCHCQFAA